MDIQVMAYTPKYIEACLEIWNRVVRDGIAFPQEEELTTESAWKGDIECSLRHW
jgi:hypothetical protein